MKARSEEADWVLVSQNRNPSTARTIIAGNLTFEQLKKTALADEIDTVLACAVDMQARLVGKRIHARWASHLVLFPEEQFAMSHTASGKPL